MSAPLTLYILRHGLVHNPDDILYGRLPGFGLSDVGRAQAQAAGLALSDTPLAALYSSPMQRAQETAQIIAAQRATPLPIQIDERLNETHTPHDGTPREVLRATWFDIYTGNQPPYEQPTDVRERVIAFVHEMRRRHADQRIAAVTHGDLVVTLFLYAKGQPGDDILRGKLEALGLPEIYPATASISELIFRTADPDEIPSYRYIKPYDEALGTGGV